GAGIGVQSAARSSSSSVVSPIALTATTTSLPARRVSTIRLATRLMLSASATDEPPNFCTINATRVLLVTVSLQGSSLADAPWYIALGSTLSSRFDERGDPHPHECHRRH